MSKPSVSIIEDAEITLEITRSIIGRSNDFEFKEAFRNAEEAIARLPKNAPDIALVDITLPGISGIDCVEKLKELCPGTQFMMFTISEDDDDVFKALQVGATGYLLKGTPPRELISALNDLHRGGSPMTASIARKVVNAFQNKNAITKKATAELTKRELELLQLLGEGLKYQEIADKLFISLETVKTHCQRVYKKLHVQSRVEAVNKAFPK